MRKITKNGTPECLQQFIDAQLAIEPSPINITYNDFDHKKQLRDILTEEQYGLCGYTGAAVDDRIARLQAANNRIRFSNHIEHLKCRKTCREEVRARGQEYGRVVGDDLAYSNMIAALEVKGAEAEQFGASKKGSQVLPVLPTDDDCLERFVFREGDGAIDGVDESAERSIEVLRLDHTTLRSWRSAAIAAWLDPEIVADANDLREVLRAVTEPQDGLLPEFAFVVESIPRQHLDEAHH
jgi:hypothetical protein